jgi:hypothetical protein
MSRAGSRGVCGGDRNPGGVRTNRSEGWSVPALLVGGVNTADGWENFATVTPDGCDPARQTP